MSRLEAVLVDPTNAGHLHDEVRLSHQRGGGILCASQGFAPGPSSRPLPGRQYRHASSFCLPARRPVGGLSFFVPALSTALEVEADQLGLKAAPGAHAYLPAPIAGLVSSDSCIFTVQRFWRGRTRASGNRYWHRHGNCIAGRRAHRFLFHGFPGPAFEGAHIRHGIRAAPGAIQNVEIGPDGTVNYDVIGGGPPIGICGSGILDALGEMRKVGILNERGRMQTFLPGVELAVDGKPIFTLMKGVDGRRDVTISQQDIDQILLAKGAIRTGIDILMDTLNVTPDRIEEFILAGAFGTYLNPLNAIRIGLFPQAPSERIRAVGNAAGTGARMMLASTDCRRRAEELAHRVEYLELTIVPGFNKFFAKGIRLPVV